MVDNDSHDATWERLQNFQYSSVVPLRLLRENTISSSYSARNAGIRAARGQILAFTDADCRPKPDWLSKLVQGFRSRRVGLVAGEIEPAPGDTWIEHYSARWGMLSQRYTLAHPYLRYAQTASLAVRRSVFLDVGLFRPQMTSGGDADLCWRAIGAGWGLEFVPEAAVLHHHRTTVRCLWEQWQRYGRGHGHLQDLHGAPVMSFAACIRLAMSQFRPARGLVSLGLAAVADLPLALLCWAAFRAGLASKDDAGDFPYLRAPHGALTTSPETLSVSA